MTNASTPYEPSGVLVARAWTESGSSPPQLRVRVTYTVAGLGQRPIATWPHAIVTDQCGLSTVVVRWLLLVLGADGDNHDGAG